MAPTRRRTDNSWQVRLVESAKRYMVLWIPLVWVLTQLGFTLVTPLLTSNKIQTQLDTSTKRLHTEVDDLREQSKRDYQSVISANRSNAELINLLVKADCLSPFLSKHDKDLIELPCDEVRALKRQAEDIQP